MLTRPPSGSNTRPHVPQRSVTTGPQQPTPTQPNGHRPNLPSRLSNVRSASGPSHYNDSTENGANVSRKTVEAWRQNQEQAMRAGAQDAVDQGDEAEEGRPRKRAKIEEGEDIVESPQDYNEDGGEEDERMEDAYKVQQGEPLELPPKASRAGRRTRRRPGPNDPMRKADGLVPPAMATRLPPPKTAADFNPWNGTHPEDILNEQVVKGGYFDKTSGMNHNESNSARASIWTNLSQKNNIALQTLSHLFTQVLDKRQLLGRCTAPSSFKPPPRVTVTDTKREAWLKDLANMAIPLRRQSRTIPHGIRGKMLMDQCLAKTIPLQRAVWLAKCVGANELRAFRRRGVSGAAAAQGEAKWVRDWTVSVEQFLDAIANAAGQDEWRRKIDYAIKLVTAFYSEHLLDREEFLGWIVRTFAAASLEKLPLWTIVVQIYWRDLIASDRRGRKLAVAILGHLRLVTEKRHSAMEQLKVRLQKLVTVLAVTKRGCLVLPRTWHLYKELLNPETSPSADPALQHALLDIVKRNEKLAGAMYQTTENTRSPLVKLYALLDCVDLNVNLEKLARECQTLVPEAAELCTALLDWASTLYRRGQARIYLAAKIISHLHITGHDTDQAILSYLQRTNDVVPAVAQHVWATIAQLVEDGCFSTGKYLQWLIASGNMFAGQHSGLATGLLAALPAGKLPLHLKNLRLTLLRRFERAGSDAAATNEVTKALDTAIEHSTMIDLARDTVFEKLAQTQRLDVVKWARDKLSEMTASEIDFAAFCNLRQLYERMGDMVAVADLIHFTASSDDLAVLATAADTINIHALSFAVLGSLAPMADRLVERHRLLRSQVPLDRTFLFALLELLERLPNHVSAQKLLESDLAAYEQQHAAAVCSPASDSLINMQAGALESDAEIDAVFASGNSMDEQTMQRVFLRVIERAGKAAEERNEVQSRVCSWLNQLRVADGPGFDKLAKEYVTAVLHKAQGQAAGTSGIMALVASNCLSLPVVEEVSRSAASPETAVTMLHLMGFALPDAGLSVLESYHFRLQQQLWCSGHPAEIARLVRAALEQPTFSLDADWMLDLVLATFTRSPGELSGSLADSLASPSVQTGASRLCKALLSQGRSAPSTGAELDPREIVSAADALNMPFTVGWLRVYVHGNAAGAAPGKDQAVREALLQAVKDRSQVWPQLLSAARPDMLRSIHGWARTRLLQAATAMFDDKSARDDRKDSDALQESFNVLGVTYSSVKDEDDSQTIAALTEKLRALDKHVDQLADQPDAMSKMRAVLNAIRILLHLAALYAQGDCSSDTSKQARSQLLGVLCTLLVQPRLQLVSSLLETIHDVSAVYVDALPTEALTSIARTLPAAHQHDKRLLSLLSSPNTPDTWLALASRAHPPPTPASAAAGPPQTAQQRALARQPPQSQAAASRIPTQGQSPASRVSAPSTRPGHSAQQQPPVEMKYTPYPLRRWEIMADPTPVMGENDCSVSLGLFGARKV